MEILKVYTDFLGNNSSFYFFVSGNQTPGELIESQSFGYCYTHIKTKEAEYIIQYGDDPDDRWRARGFSAPYPYLASIRYKGKEIIAPDIDCCPDEFKENIEEIYSIAKKDAFQSAAELLGEMMIDELVKSGLIADDERYQVSDDIIIHYYSTYDCAIIVSAGTVKRGLRNFEMTMKELSIDEIEKVIEEHFKDRA